MAHTQAKPTKPRSAQPRRVEQRSTLSATLEALVCQTRQVRYEPPHDFYNPALTIVTHKTAPKLHEQAAVKRRSLVSLLNSRKTDPQSDKEARFLNNLDKFEKGMEQKVSKNAPLKTYQDLNALRENSKPGFKFHNQPILVRVIHPEPPKKAVDERFLPREYYQRPVFSLYGTQHGWPTDAQLTEHY